VRSDTPRLAAGKFIVFNTGFEISMLEPLKLTEPEYVTLKELAEHHPYSDYRRRALGMLALAKGHPFALVAEILGVTVQTTYNWAKAWRTLGLMGLLKGHQGGAPTKLTETMLNTAEQIARKTPCTLDEIAQQLREAHPDAPKFSLDRLLNGLKCRGLYPTRTRLALKKKRRSKGKIRPDYL
jgi:transposase